VIICDTSGLIAAYDDRDPEGPAVRDLLDAEAGVLVVSPFVVAEVDYMITNRSGIEAELVLLDDLADGVYQVAEFTRADAERAHATAGDIEAAQAEGTLRVRVRDDGRAADPGQKLDRPEAADAAHGRS
jgi:predicted nucleic acid-binding protein